jgi:hypothetical protein
LGSQHQAALLGEGCTVASPQTCMQRARQRLACSAAVGVLAARATLRVHCSPTCADHGMLGVPPPPPSPQACCPSWPPCAPTRCRPCASCGPRAPWWRGPRARRPRAARRAAAWTLCCRGRASSTVGGGAG